MGLLAKFARTGNSPNVLVFEHTGTWVGRLSLEANDFAFTMTVMLTVIMFPL